MRKASESNSNLLARIALILRTRSQAQNLSREPIKLCAYLCAQQRQQIVDDTQTGVAAQGQEAEEAIVAYALIDRRTVWDNNRFDDAHLPT